MSLEPRRKPYIWPTWITPLIGGDKHCEWAAWIRAHYFYTKREETETDPDKAKATSSRENALAQWKAEHAQLVAKHAAELEADGWSVSMEDQNKFSYNGKIATVGGCPDVVASKGGVVRIDDAKTGKPRDGDFWQVAIYGLLLPQVDEAISELVICGHVVYRDRVRFITPAQIVEAQKSIIAQIHRTSATTPPARRPSASECAFCDIADCPDRVESAEVKSIDGDIF